MLVELDNCFYCNLENAQVPADADPGLDDVDVDPAEIGTGTIVVPPVDAADIAIGKDKYGFTSPAKLLLLLL